MSIIASIVQILRRDLQMSANTFERPFIAGAFAFQCGEEVGGINDEQAFVWRGVRENMAKAGDGCFNCFRC